jgi:phosphate transport system substrate-binding protein
MTAQDVFAVPGGNHLTMKWVLLAVILIAAAVVLCTGWCGGRVPAINAIGSTSIQPFAEMLAEEFNARNPANPVDVQGGGSTAGLQAAANGIADIGMCSRALKAEESGQFQAVTIARDGLAIVVHLRNPVDNLTLEQVRGIFAGEIINWRQVGGKDRPIRLITREEGSGTREAFQKLVMHKTRISRRALTQESNGAVKELVRHDPCAIGYMSLGLVGGELKAVHVDGVEPTAREVVALRYPLVRPFLFVTKGPPSPRAEAFIDFVLSPDGQAMLAKEGLVGAR